MKTKKILIIAPLPPPHTGQSIATQCLVNYLKSHFSVKILNISSGSSRKMGEKKLVLFYVRRCFEMLIFFSRLSNYLKKNKIDIVYLTISCSPLGHLRDLIFISIIRKYKKKIIIHIHSNRFRDFFTNKLLKISVQRMIKRVDKIIFLSESLYKSVQKYINREKIVFIGNSIRKELRLEDWEVEKKLSTIKTKQKIIVLYLSNLIKEKGYLDILKSAAIVQKKNLSIQFIFAGVFPNDLQKKEAFKIIGKNGLEKAIKFIGIVEQFKQLLINSDIFILPSYLDEALPISIIETMNATMPIVSTNRGGIPDMVKNNINGFIIKEKSPTDIAKAIEKLYLDRDLLIKMGKKSREIFLKNYDIDIINQKFAQLFNEI